MDPTVEDEGVAARPQPDGARVLAALREGDLTQQESLLGALSAELRRIARTLMLGQPSSHTLQTTALVNEAWLKLMGNAEASFDDRRHFLRAAARAMRSVLVDHARARAAQKRGGGELRVAFDDACHGAQDPGLEVLVVHDALRVLERLDPDAMRVVELRYFGGLTLEEAARVLGVTDRTVSNTWRRARGWLRQRLAP